MAEAQLPPAVEDDAVVEGAELAHLHDAGCASRLTMSWIDSLVRLGARKELEPADLWRLSEEQTARRRGEVLARAWAEDTAAARAKGHPRGSLVRAWRRVHARQLMQGGAVMAVLQFVQLSPYWCFNELLTVITQQRGVAVGLRLSALLVVLLCSKTLLENHYVRIQFSLGVDVRASVMHFVYSKALVLTPTARQANSVGQMVNLMQLDSEKLVLGFAVLHQLWAGLANVLLAAAMLLHVIGPAALAGLGVIVLLIPVSMSLTDAQRRRQNQAAKFTDERIKVLSEVLQGIRVLKFYSWEAAYLRRICALRGAELEQLGAKAVLKALSSVCLDAAPTFATVATFAAFVWLGGAISPATVPTVFTTLAVFTQLRVPLSSYPITIGMLGDAHVCVQRLQRFFALKELPQLKQLPALDERPQGSADGGGAGGEAGVRVDGGTFSWDPELTTDGTSGRLSDLRVGGGGGGGGGCLPGLARAPRTRARLRAWLSKARARRQWVELAHVEGPAAPVPALAPALDAGDEPTAPPTAPPPPPRAPPARSAADAPPARAPPAEVAAAADSSAAADAAPADAPAVRAITLAARPGELTLIAGAVGAGKSSLLSALLGEMRVDGGSARVHGSVAYVPQHAWVLNATVRENILFFAPYDAARYDEAVRLCSLEQDLRALAAGDATEIGERGINLSGGQKQRISIARAVYARASVLLLDDPLSALDAHVGRAIFERCIVQHLVRERCATVILVSNQLHLAPAAHRVVLLRRGCVAEAGTHAQLLGSGGEYAQLLRSLRASAGAEAEGAEGEDAAPAEASGAAPPAQPSPPRPAAGADDSAPSPSSSAVSALSAASDSSAATALAACTAEPAADAAADLEAAGGAVSSARGKALGASARGAGAGGADVGGPASAPSTAAAAPAHSGALTSTEQRARGAIASGVYAEYLRAAGGWAVGVAVLALYVASQLNIVASDAWLSVWSEGTRFPARGPRFYLGVYLGLGVSLALCTFVRALAFACAGLRAARRLHARLALVVLQGSMAFFDTTPLGRVLARFASDMNKLDETLPKAVEVALHSVASLCATCAVIASVMPAVVLAAAPLVYAYARTQAFYRASALQLKRLDQSARGPLYSFFSESLSGLPSIRAYARGGTFARAMEARIDASTRAVWATYMIARWLSLRLELLGNLVIGAAAVGGVLAQGTSSGLVGLALAYAFRATTLLAGMVRFVTDAQTQMTASEQILLYVDTVETEPSIEPATAALVEHRARTARAACACLRRPRAGGAQPDGALAERARDARAWLGRGEVEFAGVTMRYRPELEPAVRRVSFHVPAGAKVGIVGRTGSGKSSTMLLLMRMVQPAEGAVRIDGRDVRTLSLEQLRGAVSMIPQDPVLFSGSVRSNLDPFGLHADQRIWEVLERAQLASAVRAAGPGGLEAEVAEYGENFSVGQRQLICLARALLREGRLLLMDEATSSVDYETDRLIQALIREEFAASTVITIAHRINTIIDSDKIVVLCNGELAECGAPHELLRHAPANEGAGSFAKLVEETGAESAAHLREVAAARKA